MSVANFVFVEASPAAPGNAASSQPVLGSDAGLPGGVLGLIGDFRSAYVVAELVGATGGTLDVYVQLSPDSGLNWYDVIHFAQLASGASAVIYSAPLSIETQTAAPVAVGKGGAPALASGKVVNGVLTDRMRLMMVAGSGTSAGAQVVVRVSTQRPRIRETGA